MSEIASTFERYRPLVGDWDAFLHAVHRPLPPCIWVRPDRGDLQGALTEDGLLGQPLGWIEGGMRLNAHPNLLESLAYRAGLIHVLEEVSMLPALLLDPNPGERILDLCAAPGNKTVLVAAAMQGTGTLVANDPGRDRHSVTRTSLHRMGVANVTLVDQDGAHPGWEGTGFDRVLVDAPCSCEGTVRKHPGVACRTGPDARQTLASLQRRLLLSAVDACRPGGRIVYATCTFAPEENEAVVADVLAERRQSVRLIPMRIDGLRHSPGLTEWDGAHWPSALRHAIRIWPHQADTGGFFCAVLERTGDPGPRSGLSVEQEAADDLLEPVMDRFGMDRELIRPFRSFRETPRYVSVVPRDHRPSLPFPLLSSGLSIIRTTSAVPKLTTQGAIFLGNAASRNTMDVDRPRANAFVRREDIRGRVHSPGHVLLRWQGHPLGVGLARGAGADTIVESLYPRHWAGLNPAGTR